MIEVPVAADQLANCDEPLVKSAEYEVASKPTSAGHVFSVGLQSVEV